MKKVLINCGIQHWFPKGSQRLRESFQRFDNKNIDIKIWINDYPTGSYTHESAPYYFKYAAFKWAKDSGYDIALWLDSSFWAQHNPEKIFDKIETDGYLLFQNGFMSGTWCADSQLKPLNITREESFKIPHLIGGIIGLNFNNELSNNFLNQMLNLPPEAFRGAYTNENNECSEHPDVKGSRHDQTAASVISHRLGMKWEMPQGWIDYSRANKDAILLLEGM